MTFAEPYDRRCSLCGQIYRSDDPGARWTNLKGNPRYLHPNCRISEKPGRGWKQVQPDQATGAFRPMATAPKDGSEIEILFRHRNWQYATGEEQRSEWEQVCRAYWIDFNSGGWVWEGLAGIAIGWRPLNGVSLFTGGI